MNRNIKRRAAWRGLSCAVLCLVAAGLPAAEPKPGVFKTKAGVEMKYITLGDAGSWVVLIPGLSDNPQRMYIDSGIAAALAKNHRVVATPQPADVSGPEDIMELMDSLKIDKAHVYGYSMGGGFTGSLLAWHPERFITAAFGGSGIWEYEQEQHDRADALDKGLLAAAGQTGRGGGAAGGAGAPARGARAGAGAAPRGGGPGRGMGSAQPPANQPESAAGPVPVAAARPHSRTPIDLSKVTIPVLSINGSLDQPYAKSQRMWRELGNYQNVILPGLNHMTAIGVGSEFPPQHVDALVRFVNANEE